MDQVIERNTERLRVVLAALVAMAGFSAAFTSPLWGGRREASGGGGCQTDTPTRPSDDGRPPLNGEVNPPTLPRHVRNAVLRLLRPAEAAARRLIVIAARKVVVTLGPSRLRKPSPRAQAAALRGLGLAVTLSPATLARIAAEKRAAARQAAAAAGRPYLLPLVDPPRRFRFRPRTVPRHAAPRIAWPGLTPLHTLPLPPSPGDPIDATRLGLRLKALAAALDDLPGQALRLARWKARRERASGSAHRASPLRPGRAPGLPLAHSASPHMPGARRRPAHAVHDLLADLHYFARDPLRHPDTS